MVVIADRKPEVSTNFAIPIQPPRPFFVMEYVSKTNSRKDYQESYDKYEAELKVPYYLLFYPETQELTLFKLNKRKGKYASVHPDDEGYVAIPELDLTIKLLDGWARFWWKGKLLPIPTELQAKLVRVEKENVALRRENAATKIIDASPRPTRIASSPRCRRSWSGCGNPSVDAAPDIAHHRTCSAVSVTPSRQASRSNWSRWSGPVLCRCSPSVSRRIRSIRRRPSWSRISSNGSMSWA